MEYVEQVFASLFQGSSPNSWLAMKFFTAAAGGFSAFIFKYYYPTSGETQIQFLWKGFWFTIISAIGGVFILAPQTAFNAFVSGLLGWGAIAKLLEQGNKGASGEGFSQESLTEDEINKLKNMGGNNG
jgi:hypothetical protein